MAAKALELEGEGPDGPRTVRVSSPEKVYFAELGVTKADVVRYFLAVGEGILGTGEMPYPPNFPKMPGEPKRVQPSRAREDT